MIKRSGTSKSEQYIYSELKKLYKDKFKIKNRDRTIISPLEVDIAIYYDKFNIAIEYNGACHSKMIYGKSLRTRSKKFAAILKRDLLKESKLKQLGWKFIIIKYDGTYNEIFLNDVIKKIKKIIKDLEQDKFDFDRIIIK